MAFVDYHKGNFQGLTKEPSLTGELLGQSVLNQLNLNLNKCIKIITDCYGVICSEQKKAVSKLLDR